MARSGRTTSLARGVVWGYWWRRLLSFILFDLVLITVTITCFYGWGERRAAADGLGAGTLTLDRGGQILDRVVYDAPLKNGEHRLYRLSAFVKGTEPIFVTVLAGEALGIILLPLSTRRVRRRLQPLNDLALEAEELGRMASEDLHKIESLEHAIHSATVDSPHVSTGDKDLQSIEIALNGLLRQMQEAKLQQMRFVSDASHELRTPIAVIQGYVNMLDRWGKTDEAVLDESIAALKTESEHMQTLVEQLLFLARGDSGRNTLQFCEMNVAEVLFEVWEESRMIDEAHTYTLDVPGKDVHDRFFTVTGDAAMIKQVARILVQNAAAYSAPGTEIVLGVRAEGQSVSLRVQDEGIGMSEADAAHVFERFYRADAARDRREGGCGLGLSIAQWIVSAHGGTIELLSYEGVGTRFTVVLPREGRERI